MSTTTTTVHCEEREPDELKIFMQDFDSFCVLNLDMRPTSGHESHNYDVMLPLSMLPRLTRAVNAFNAAMGTEQDVIEPAPIEEPAS
jgi:hypothetical protein